MYVFINEWPPIGKTAHTAYGMFSEYEYLIVKLGFPISAFGVGISF